MSEGYADFVARRHAKNCKVVLERLEGESLKKCLQKYGLKLTSQNGYKKRPLQRKCHSKTDKPMKRKRRKRKNSELFVLRRNRRKHIKPLDYTDSENEENFKVQRNITMDDHVEPKVILKGSDSLLHTSNTMTNIKTELEVLRHENLTTEESSLGNRNKSERKTPESKVKEKNELKHCLKNSFCNIENNCATSGDNDGEVEIIQVLSGSTSGKANCDDRKSAEPPSKRQSAANSELVSKEELLEDDYDSREDSEDDRNTVIFEEEFHKDTDPEELLDIEERECVSKKFNNREITNRKRQRLKKFKKKSMPGRNLAFIKAKTKVAEGISNEQEGGEKTIHGVSEECLAEVCNLVERLHELYRIILQLKKELPKNSELAFHFTRVINAQQENFHREIRKSQKTIIKCYEKMLSFYSDTSQVARVIGKRTSLSVEDIVNVISRCILIEGQCETDDTVVGNQEKALNNIHKKIRENLTNPAKASQSECPLKQQMVNNCISSSPYIPISVLHFNHRPKSVHRPSGEIRTAWSSAAMEKTPASSNSWAKEYLPFYTAHQIMRKNNPHTRVQQNPFPSSYFRGPRPVQLLQSQPSQMSPRTTGFVVRQFPPKPMASHLANVNSQFSVGFPVERLRPPHISRDINYTTRVFQPENPSAAGTKDISNVVSRGSVVLPAVQNNTEYNRNLNQVFENGQNSDSLIEVTDGLRSSAHPSVKNLIGPVANSQNQSIPLSVSQCPLDTILTDSVRPSDHKGLFVKPVELYGRNCSVNSMPELENSESHDVQEVLDPTIPQKLTMRNCRLQAGPVLVLEDDCTRKLNSPQSLTENRKPSTDSRNLGREDSKSRVYVCAQNDCKSPGVRICKGCQSVIYCSETCQLKHWSLKHKSECYQLKALRG